MKQITITIPDEMERFIKDNTLLDGIIDSIEQFKRDAFILQPYIYMEKLSFEDACKILDTSPEILSDLYTDKNLPLRIDPRDKIYSITDLRYIARDIFDEVGYVEKAYLYGSYAKGTATKRSNINIVVELNKDAGSKFLELMPLFERETQKEIILYTTKELSPKILNIIEKEFVPLYEVGMLDPIGW